MKTKVSFVSPETLVGCLFMLFLINNNNLYSQNYPPQRGRSTDFIFRKIPAQTSIIKKGINTNNPFSTSPGFSYSLQDGDVKEFVEGTDYKIQGKYSIKQEVVKDTVLSNGLTYKQIRWTPLLNSIPDTLYYEYERVDADGNVHTFYNNEDKLLYVFNLDSGAVFNSQYPGMKWRVASKYNVTGYGLKLQGVDFELIDSSLMVWETTSVLEKFGLIYYDRVSREPLYTRIGEYWGAILGKEKFGEVLAITNDTDLREFYPLKPGNIWKYEMEQLGTHTELRKCIKDTVLSDNYTYSKISVRNFLNKYSTGDDVHYERIDSLGNIYSDFDHISIGKRYKLSTCVGDTFYTSYGYLYRLDNKFYYDDDILNKTSVMLVLRLKEVPWGNDIYFSKGLGVRQINVEGVGGPDLLVGAVLDGISYGDTTSITTSVEEIIAGVKDYDLLQNYPNPFNPSTTLRYYLSRPSHIVLEIYSFIGEKVKELVNKEQHSGTYEITWNGKDENSKEVSSGVYFAWLKLTSPGIASKTLIHKLLLTK